MSAPIVIPTTKTLGIDEVIPYWRNPRQVSQETVNAIAESISRYGYQQPIVVDEDNVIIIGHTRYAAMRRLGVTELPVAVASGLTPEKVKQLRVIDNKAAEYTLWDFDKLQTELAGIDAEAMQGFFADMSGDDGGVSSFTTTLDFGPGASAEGGDPADETEDDEDNLDVEFTCPSCFHSFEKHVTRDAIMKGRIA